jgi:diaminopimelate epimerase
MSYRLPFAKMHGAGNDFVMVDQRDLPEQALDPDRIAAICDRRQGVGADGLIVIGPGTSTATAFTMTYFNADGGEAEMCGNGARCSVSFAHRLGLVNDRCRFDTGAGVLAGVWHGPADIEITLTPWSELALNLEVTDSPWTAHHFCNTGVPHLVIPVTDIEAVPVATAGSQLRHLPQFAPRGTNVNWVARSGDEGPFLMRTYERGVEAETLACGTGAAAGAVVLCRLGEADSPVDLRTRGGERLSVGVDLTEGTLTLRGPAVTSFQGEVWIDE